MATPVCVLHHHIGTESKFESGLGIATARPLYEAQIVRLARDYDIIDLDTLLSGRLPRRPLLLTFDDVYHSVLCVAREILHPSGLPAVFFINPGLLGKNMVSLDCVLAWAANTVGLSRLCELLGCRRFPDVGTLIEDMGKYNTCKRADIKAKIIDALGPLDLTQRAQILEKDDLKELSALGIDIGNHTMNHVSCRALDDREIEEEIVTAKEKLEIYSGTRVRAFSVPYGHEMDLTPEILAVLRRSGHEAIFLVHARSNRFRPAPDIWYRTSIHNEDPRVLLWKLRVEPGLRSIKNRMMG